jgi:hypothetical protein
MLEMLQDPAKIQEKMAELQQLLGSPEGQEISQNIMKEMQSVLTDPDKMRVGLEQFASNPMLAGMAESMPELKAVLDNPALMEESIAQAQKLFSGMAEGGLGGLGGLSNEKLQEAMKLMGGGGDDMAGSIQEALKMMGGLGLDGAKLANTEL